MGVVTLSRHTTAQIVPCEMCSTSCPVECDAITIFTASIGSPENLVSIHTSGDSPGR